MAKVAGIDLGLWGLPPRSHLLDLGAASGVVATELAQLGFKVSGVEYDASLVEEFKKSDQKNFPVTVIHGDARKLPFRESEFNGALALEVLEHIKETDQVLSELSRVIKTGGRLVVGVPTDTTEKIYQKLNPRFAEQAGHVHIFTKDFLKEKLEQHGFRVYRTQGENFEYAPLWFGLALTRVPFHFTGKTYHETLWEKIYWRGLKLLGLLRLRGLVNRLGNLVLPRSNYFYAEKV